MKNLVLLTTSLFTLSASLSFGLGTDSTWISTSDQTWGNTANWSPAVTPSTTIGAIFQDSATVQHTINLSGLNPITVGMQFSSFAGGSGFVFNNAGFLQLRSGGSVSGIVNNDDSVQTFNIAITMSSINGGAGNAASMTFNAAAGPLVFTGGTISNNGGRLTNSGAFNITIGTTGGGILTGTGGLVKNGAGTLTLGGTSANTYSGSTIVNQGSIIAAKASAFGTSASALTLNGGTVNSGGFNQTSGTLTLSADSTLDLGAGTSAWTFADSSAISWAGTLHILDWTQGSDSIRAGTGPNSLTFSQLGEISWDDLPGISQTLIDSNGFLVPIPEPSTVALSLLGGFGLAVTIINRRRKA